MTSDAEHASPLEAFLEQERRLGEKESEGCFTLSLQQALEKFGAHRLLRRQFYLLKFVQAAVRAGAEKIRFRFNGNSASCGFLVPAASALLDVDGIGTYLEGPGSSKLPAELRHLAAGLFAAPPEWVWKVTLLESTVYWQRRGSEFTRLVEEEYEGRQSRNTGLWAECSLLLPRGVNQAADRGALALQTRHCPIPVYVNGVKTWAAWDRRPLPTHYYSQQEAGDDADLIWQLYLTEGRKRPGFVLPAPPWNELKEVSENDFVWKGPGRWSLSGTSFLDGRPTWLTRFDRAPDRADENLGCDLALRLPLELNGPLFLDAVIDGVSLPTTTYGERNYFGTGLMATANPEDTDLSEFQLREDVVGKLLARVEPLRKEMLNIFNLNTTAFGKVQRGRPAPATGPLRRHFLMGTSQTTTDPELGRLYGNYRLTSVLNRARFSSLYLAHDAQVFKHPFVIKVFTDTSEDFNKVAWNWARQQQLQPCKGIITILECDHLYGNLYLVMPLLEGQSLNDLWSGMSVRNRTERYRHLAALADCLIHLREADRVHGDLKPGNIMVGRDGTITLLDPLRPTPDARQLHLGLFRFSYQAPEQVSGARLTPATDLYILGLLLYEALTGHQPRGGGNMKSLLALMTEPPPDPRETSPEADPLLSELALRCLAIDPSERDVTLEELGHSLRQCSP